MKRFLISIIFIALGSGLWWLLSASHHVAIKKWDAKFENVVRHSLNSIGIKDSDILSSLNVVKTDDKGKWVTKELTLSSLSSDQVERIKQELEAEGATVTQTSSNSHSTLLIKRGQRLYQQIRFPK